MPLAPVIAASLALGLPDRIKGLYVDGLDVLKQPGSGGNRFHVPLESIVLVEAGPGDVSTLSFTIADPAGDVGIASGQLVRFVDLVTGVPLFLGFVDTWGSRPLGIGRSIAVKCIGVEAVLDWLYVPEFTVTDINAIFNDYIAQGIGGAPGIGFALNYAYPITGVGPSTQARPMGAYGAQSITFPLVVEGGTLRRVLAQLNDVLVGQQTAASPSYNGGGWVATVDFYGGLRWWDATGWFNTKPQDWVSTAIGPVNKPANLEHVTSLGDAVRQVYVIGGNAAGTGLVSSGSGAVGPTAVLEDATILTAGAMLAAGRSYLAAHGQTVEGSFGAEEYLTAGAIGAERHAGAEFVLTDAQAGVAGLTVAASRITKTFVAGGVREMWTVDYGSRDSRASVYLRRLSRTVQ